MSSENTSLTRNEIHQLAIHDAPLPPTYERAKHALAECVRIDECKEWADKALAMRSYAKQASDDSLYKDALRVQAHAIRRCGELLLQIQDNNRGRPSAEIRDAGVPNLTRKEAADEAGLSERQRKTAIRVARVPEAEFEEAIESAQPPTISELARKGTVAQSAPQFDLEGRAPGDFKLATKGMGILGDLAKYSQKTSAQRVAAGVLSHEVEGAVKDAEVVRAWLAEFVRNLQEASE